MKIARGRDATRATAAGGNGRSSASETDTGLVGWGRMQRQPQPVCNRRQRPRPGPPARRAGPASVERLTGHAAGHPADYGGVSFKAMAGIERPVDIKAKALGVPGL